MALAIKAELPGARADVGSDVAPEAVALAKRNAAALGWRSFRLSDLLADPDVAYTAAHCSAP